MQLTDGSHYKFQYICCVILLVIHLIECRFPPLGSHIDRANVNDRGLYSPAITGLTARDAPHWAAQRSEGCKTCPVQLAHMHASCGHSLC